MWGSPAGVRQGKGENLLPFNFQFILKNVGAECCHVGAMSEVPNSLSPKTYLDLLEISIAADSSSARGSLMMLLFFLPVGQATVATFIRALNITN